MILLLLLSPSLLPEEDLISAVKYSLCNEEGATKNKRSGMGGGLKCGIPKFSTAAMPRRARSVSAITT